MFQMQKISSTQVRRHERSHLGSSRECCGAGMDRAGNRDSEQFPGAVTEGWVCVCGFPDIWIWQGGELVKRLPLGRRDSCLGRDSRDRAFRRRGRRLLKTLRCLSLCPISPKLHMLLTGCLPCPDSMYKTKLLPFKLCSSACIPPPEKKIALPFPEFFKLKINSDPWSVLLQQLLPLRCPSALPSLGAWAFSSKPSPPVLSLTLPQSRPASPLSSALSPRGSEQNRTLVAPLPSGHNQHFHQADHSLHTRFVFHSWVPLEGPLVISLWINWLLVWKQPDSDEAHLILSGIAETCQDSLLES